MPISDGFSMKYYTLEHTGRSAAASILYKNSDTGVIGRIRCSEMSFGIKQPLYTRVLGMRETLINIINHR